jgi:DivIVA domain-containing protein
VELTPQVVNDIEFRTKKVGGYDPDEVDDFLEQVAAGIEELRERAGKADERVAAADARARAADERAADAEMRAQNAAETDDTLKRTLVLAQRTADSAIKEAEEEAVRTIAAAQERAERIVQDAETTSRRMLEEAEVQATKGVEERRAELLREIAVTEQTRDAMLNDVQVLEQHLGAQRERLQRAAADLQRLVDEPGFSPVPVPELSGASGRDVPVGSVVSIADDIEAAAPPTETEPEEDAAAGDEAGELVESVEDGDETTTDELFSADDVDNPFAGNGDDDQAAADAGADSGPPTEPVGRLGLFDGVNADPAVVLAESQESQRARENASASVDDDAYLSELRKAMIEDAHSGPENDLDEELEVETHRRSRFGRRR